MDVLSLKNEQMVGDFEQVWEYGCIGLIRLEFGVENANVADDDGAVFDFFEFGWAKVPL